MEEIHTTDAPASKGVYSQAIRDGSNVIVSGQGPINPETGNIVEGGVQEQTAQTLKNIGTILEAAGTSLDNVVKTTVFIQNMDNYDVVNEVYGEYMSEPYPARSAVEVSDLPIDIEVEIEAVASVK